MTTPASPSGSPTGSAQESPSSRFDPINRLADEFVERYRRGERPSLTEYTEKYPELAERIRELFPAMVIMERLGTLDVAADDETTGARSKGPVPRLLGEYRIIREVGHGGMGVVYEAIQETLGRHVALKVLPFHRLLGSHRLERFQREARAAARLHHTNIVPVFGVGEDKGIHYYVMQFIQGQGLDEVLREVARLRRLSKVGRSGDGKEQSEVASAGHPLAVISAHSLMTGEFAPRPPSAPTPPSPRSRSTPAQDRGARLEDRGVQASATTTPSVPVQLPRSSSADETPPMPAGDSGGSALSTLTGGKSQLTAQSDLQYFRGVAQIGVQVAEALEYAHRQGIYHRDIKPSNLLLDTHGTAWITDFGLAKAETDEDLSRPGDIVGTVRYMAPERFTGQADARSDVYSLGVTLFELLTLLPLFQDSDKIRLITRIRSEESPPLRRIDKRIPRDLENIVLKAIRKEPGRRYQSGLEMAEDLRRFLSDEPIRARREGPLERARRWCRHNRRFAALLAVIFGLLSAIVVVLAFATARFQEQAATERRLVGEKEAERLKAELLLTDLHTSHGLVAADRQDAARAMLWFAAAAGLTSDADRQSANRLRARAWGREAVLPVRAVGHGGAPLRKLDFHPGGEYLLTLTEAGGCFVWDLAREEPLGWANGASPATAAAFSPDGDWLALGRRAGRVEVRAVPSGELLYQLDHPGPVAALAFSPDGRWLAAASNVVRVWDCRAKQFTAAAWKHPQPVHSLVFSPDGDQLATACRDRRVRVFAVPPAATASPLFPPVPHAPDREAPPAFVEGGRGLVTLSGGFDLAWWDARTGKPAGLRKVRMKVDGVREIRASPDGTRFAVAGWHHAQLWHVAEPGPDGLLLSHVNVVGAVAFSPDGTVLLTGCWDRTARLWAVHDGKPLGYPLPHQDTVTNVAFSPDGLFLATGQENGLVRVWRMPAAPLGSRAIPFVGNNVRLKQSGDGRLAIPGRLASYYHRDMGTPRLRVFEVATGDPAGPDLEFHGGCEDAALSGDGRLAAAVVGTSRGAVLYAWDVATGRAAWPPLPLLGTPVGVVVSPDGTRVAALSLARSLDTDRPTKKPRESDWQAVVAIADARTGQQQHLFRGDAPADRSWTESVHFTADGALVVANSGSAIHLIETTTGRPRWSLRPWQTGTSAPPGSGMPAPPGGPGFLDLALSGDGKLLAAAVRGPQGNAVQVWELPAWAAGDSPVHARAPLLPHPDYVFGLCFTPDGRRLLTGCRDGQARVWDWAAGRLAVPPLTQDDEVLGVAVTRDGRWALTTSRSGALAGGSVRVWDLTTGKPVTPVCRLGTDNVHGAVVTPDGSAALVSVRGRPLFALDLRDLYAPDDGPGALAELAAGQRVHDGDLAGLTSDEWLARWMAFRQERPGYGARTPAERAHGHLRAAAAHLAADRPGNASTELRHAGDVLDPAMRDRPDDPALLPLAARANRLRGAVARRGGKFGEAADHERLARAAYEQLVAREPADPATVAELADLLLATDRPGDWTILDQVEPRSAGGATFTRQSDGSVLVGGPRPDTDTYVVVARTPLAGITGLRLEVIPDAGLANGGSGRGPSGNFHLSEVTLTAAAAGGEPEPVPLTAALADHEQVQPHASFLVRFAIDGNDRTHWAVGPRVGEPHWAMFVPARPVGAGGGTTLTVTLHFKDRTWKQHTLGRFRLAVTARPDPLAAELLTRLARKRLWGWSRLAAAYAAAGEWPPALEALRRAVPAPTGGTGYEYFLLALAHARLSHPDEARRWYDGGMDWLKQHGDDEALRQLARRAITDVAGLTGDEADRALRQTDDEREFARLTRAVEQLPDTVPPLDRRCRWHLRNGNWRAAANDWLRVVQLLPDTHQVLFQAAPLLLQAGDTTGYLRHCDDLLKRFGDTRDPFVAERTAKACLLLPRDPAHAATAARLADRAAREAKNDQRRGYFEVTRLLAECRLGRPDGDPHQRLAPYLAGDTANWDLLVSGHLVLALAHLRQDRPDAARAALARAVQLLDQRAPSIADADDGWHDWLFCLLLRQEVEARLP